MPEEAFSSLLPSGCLPPSPLMSAPTPTTWPDGTVRTGIAKDYDIVLVDVSRVEQAEETMECGRVWGWVGGWVGEWVCGWEGVGIQGSSQH